MGFFLLLFCLSLFALLTFELIALYMSFQCPAPFIPSPPKMALATLNHDGKQGVHRRNAM